MWEYRDTAELYHHGILGMKWGKRNGPPYPLDESDKSYAEKQAKAEQRAARAAERKQKRVEKSEARRERSEVKKEQKMSRKKRKKLIAIGALAVGTALVISKNRRNKEAREYKNVLKDLNLGSLNDEGLKNKIGRLEMEKKVIDLSLDRGAAKRGVNAVNSILKDSGPNIGKQVLEKVGVSVLTGGALYLAKSAASKSFSGKELGEALFNGGPKKK